MVELALVRRALGAQARGPFGHVARLGGVDAEAEAVTHASLGRDHARDEHLLAGGDAHGVHVDVERPHAPIFRRSPPHGHEIGEQSEQHAGDEDDRARAVVNEAHDDRRQPDDADQRERQHAVVDEKSHKLPDHAGEEFHDDTWASRRRTTTASAETQRRSTAKPRIARSAPGQEMPSPSPVQKRPKADSITPTVNLSVFSGTRASGRCTTSPTTATSAQAASAPMLAGTSSPRPAPTAITTNTTSSPSSSIA